MSPRLAAPIALLLLLLLTACNAHSPAIVHSTTDSTPNVAAGKYPPHTRPVRVSEAGLPPGVAYEVLEKIDFGSAWYGDFDVVDKHLAERARAIGADAVINVKHWHQPSGFSWSAPHGSGEAIKLKDPASVDLGALPGASY